FQLRCSKGCLRLDARLAKKSAEGTVLCVCEPVRLSRKPNTRFGSEAGAKHGAIKAKRQARPREGHPAPLLARRAESAARLGKLLRSRHSGGLSSRRHLERVGSAGSCGEYHRLCLRRSWTRATARQTMGL